MIDYSELKEKKNKEEKESKYIPPTDEQVFKFVYSPGTFRGKCQRCKMIISADTIQDIRKHRCQN